MVAIYKNREELTSNKVSQNNWQSLLEDVNSSLFDSPNKHRNIIGIPFSPRSSTEVSYTWQAQYQDPAVIGLLEDYITQIRNQIQHPNVHDKKLFQDKKTIDTLPKVSSEINLEITKNRLIALLQEDDEDDDGVLKPTPYAFDKAWTLVRDASYLMKESFPKAWVSTNEEGGIRLTWSRLEIEAEVRLICGSKPDKKTYLYHEKGDKYGVVEDVSGLSLAGWLQWLSQV